MANQVNLCLSILVGLPASGKTTLANSLHHYFESTPNSILCPVSYDDFVPLEIQRKFASSPTSIAKQLRQEFLKTLNREILKLVGSPSTKLEGISQDMQELSIGSDFEDADLQEIVSNLDTKMSAHIAKIKSDERFSKSTPNVIVLVDDNNYYSSMRNEFYDIAKKYGFGFCVIYVSVPLKTCRLRNSSRPESRQLPDNVLVTMSSKLEVPDPMKNVCDTYCVEISEESQKDINLKLLGDILEASSRNPVKWEPPPDRSQEVERSRRQCSTSEIHQADLTLRKVINTQMLLHSSSKVSKRNLAKKLNNHRLTFIDSLRSGEIKVCSQVEDNVSFVREITQLFSEFENVEKVEDQAECK